MTTTENPFKSDLGTKIPPVEVIILCQGEQQRLPDLTRSKQLLPLPACRMLYPDSKEPATILERTLLQLAILLAGNEQDDDGALYSGGHVTVVGREDMYFAVAAAKHYAYRHARGVPGSGVRLHANQIKLSNPGNSSLRGVAEFLKIQSPGWFSRADRRGRCVVLLGDVVYSWAALRACLNFATPPHPLDVDARLDGRAREGWGVSLWLPSRDAAWVDWRSQVPHPITFCGTSTLSPSAGELWGMQWDVDQHARMMGTLFSALEKHPPFAEYQPGQLRRWLWATSALQTSPFVVGDAIWREAVRQRWYLACDDYTRDVDLPEHVAMLGGLSEQAAVDDKENGLSWA